MDVFKIAMLGSSGVGKTSLMAAMYEAFQAVSDLDITNLMIEPDLESAAFLDKNLRDLKSLTNEFKVKPGVGISGTASTQELRFTLAKKGDKPFLGLQFYEYPGGYIFSNALIQERKFIREILDESIAVIIVIDATAMMEAKGRWHEFINKPKLVTEILQEAYFTLDKPKLLIFAPVKCEIYMKNSKSANQLLNQIKKDYARLLEFLASETLNSKVAVVVTPVQTVGNVVFSRIEISDSMPFFYFRKTRYDEQYNPRYCEQPLLYILLFLLIGLLNPNKGLFGKFYGSLYGSVSKLFYRRDLELEKVVSKLAKTCKNTDGFAVLQGEKFLNII